jgi:hypothetical protein
MTTPDRPKHNELHPLAPTQNKKAKPVRAFEPLPEHLLDRGWDTMRFHVEHAELREFE